MQKKEGEMNYKYFQMDNLKGLLEAKEREALQHFEEKQRRKVYINGQAKKLQNIANYVRSLGVFKQMLPPLTALKAHCVSQQIIQKVIEKDVIKSSQNRYQRMVKTGTIKKNWSSEDLSILIWLICKFSQTNSIPIEEVQFHEECWEMIEQMIPGTTAEECLFKWMGFKKQSVTQYSWNKEEEDLLLLLQKKYKHEENRWKIISKQLYKLNTDQNKIYRQPKQCREHFNSFLDPTIKKGIWNVQEDYMLVCAYLKFNCQRRWCQITRCFKNRTENSLKNRFQLLYGRLKITKKGDKAAEIELLKNYTKQLRDHIISCSLEDELTAQADQMRKQALEGNVNISETRNKAEMFEKAGEQQVNLKKEQNQSQNSYIIVKSTSKQEKTLNSPLVQDVVREEAQEEKELKLKSQTSISSISTSPNKSIIIPQFQYKQNVSQDHILIAPLLSKEAGLRKIQNPMIQFPFIYESFYCEPYFFNKPSFQSPNNAWK